MQDEHSQSRRFDDMKSQIDGIAAKQDVTSRNVHEILAILRGDDFAEGMVAAVKNHEKRITKLENIKSKATWTVLGMSIPAGYGLLDLAKELWAKLVGAIAILLLFTGCITEQKRADIFHRHAREVPADVLVYCPEPSVVVKPGKPDTVTVTETKRVPVYVTETDTIWADCPEHEVRTVYKTDTATVIDQAPVMVLADRLERSERDLAHERGKNEQLREQNADQGRRLAKQWWLSVGLGVGLLLSIALRFVKF